MQGDSSASDQTDSNKVNNSTAGDSLNPGIGSQPSISGENDVDDEINDARANSIKEQNYTPADPANTSTPHPAESPPPSAKEPIPPGISEADIRDEVDDTRANSTKEQNCTPATPANTSTPRSAESPPPTAGATQGGASVGADIGDEVDDTRANPATRQEGIPAAGALPAREAPQAGASGRVDVGDEFDTAQAKPTTRQESVPVSPTANPRISPVEPSAPATRANPAALSGGADVGDEFDTARAKPTTRQESVPASPTANPRISPVEPSAPATRANPAALSGGANVGDEFDTARAKPTTRQESVPASPTDGPRLNSASNARSQSIDKTANNTNPKNPTTSNDTPKTPEQKTEVAKVDPKSQQAPANPEKASTPNQVVAAKDTQIPGKEAETPAKGDAKSGTLVTDAATGKSAGAGTAGADGGANPAKTEVARDKLTDVSPLEGKGHADIDTAPYDGKGIAGTDAVTHQGGTPAVTPGATDIT